MSVLSEAKADNLLRASQDAVAELERSGGFTLRVAIFDFKVIGHLLLKPETMRGRPASAGVFAVGGAGPLTAYSTPDPERNPQKHVFRMISRMVSALYGTGATHFDLGGWRDPNDGVLWIEPVSLEPSHAMAQACCRTRGERAYQDLLYNTTYSADGTLYAANGTEREAL